MTRLLSDTAPGLIRQLGLAPHPEGGHFRETYRHHPQGGGCGRMTAIYYLLEAGEVSRWHRVRDADELWIFQTGGALDLTLSADGQAREERRLGLDLAAGETPQLLVPASCWQTARTRGLFTLVTCIVTPAFEFASFELAPADWQPGGPGYGARAVSFGPSRRGLPPRGPRRRR